MQGYSYSEGLLSLLHHDSRVPQSDDSDEYMISTLGEINQGFLSENPFWGSSQETYSYHTTSGTLGKGISLNNLGSDKNEKVQRSQW